MGWLLWIRAYKYHDQQTLLKNTVNWFLICILAFLHNNSVYFKHLNDNFFYKWIINNI